MPPYSAAHTRGKTRVHVLGGTRGSALPTMSTLCIRDRSISSDTGFFILAHTPQRTSAQRTRPSTKNPAMIPAISAKLKPPPLPAAVSSGVVVVVEERFPLARFAAGLAMALLGVVALGGEMVFGRLVVVLFTVEGGARYVLGQRAREVAGAVGSVTGAVDASVAGCVVEILAVRLVVVAATGVVRGGALVLGSMPAWRRAWLEQALV